MKEPIYKVSCIVIGSKCAVMRSTSQFSIANIGTVGYLLDSLHNLITVQPPCSTRSSSLVTLARPSTSSSLRITDRSFQYASPRLWNQLSASHRQPRTNLFHSDSSTSVTPSIGSVDSPVSSPIRPSPFHRFIPGLKPSFSANPFHRGLPFLLQD